MKTRKDAITYTTLFIWLCVNFATFIYYGSEYLVFSNFGFIILFIVLILVKRTSIKFDDWLERPF